MFYRGDDGGLVHGVPTWEQNVTALAEALGRWRANNPRSQFSEPDPAVERAAIVEETRRTMLDELYPLGGVGHEAAFARLTHQDLPALSAAQLQDERGRLRMRLYLERNPGPWLRERLLAIEEEAEARSHEVESA